MTATNACYPFFPEPMSFRKEDDCNALFTFEVYQNGISLPRNIHRPCRHIRKQQINQQM